MLDTQTGRSRPATPDDLAGVSPLLHPGRVIAISSPYAVNEALLLAMPAGQRAGLGDTLARARRFEPVDRQGYRADPRAFGLTIAVAHDGAARMTASVMRRGMAMTVLEPSADSYTFGVRKRGGLAVAGCGRDSDGSWGGGTGVLYRERPGARISTTDDHAGLSFELPYARIVGLLEALLDRPVAGSFAFAPAVALNREPGASLARAIAYIEQELAMPGSLLAGGAAQDLLIRLLLAGQPHSHSQLLARAPAAAAPFHVTRAEAFMRAHGQRDVSVEQLALVAGCSVRSLQAAFKRFRGCSPMQALTATRLDMARDALQAGGADKTVAEIARGCGFANMGRFSQLYGARFGEWPSQTRQVARARLTRERASHGVDTSAGATT